MKPSNGPPPCDVTDDELIAYQDRDLPPDRLAELDLHVPACPRCQGRLDESAALGGMIRSAVPDLSEEEIESGRARLIERLREEQAARPTTPPRQRRPAIPTGAWRIAVVALLLAGLTSYILIPRESWANFPLARVVRFTIDEDLKERDPAIAPESSPLPTAEATARPPQMDGALQFKPVAPETLPGGFELVNQSSAGQGAVELEYMHASGLTITVTQSLAGSANTAIERENYQLASAGKLQVLYLFNPSLGSVSHAVWTDDGLL